METDIINIYLSALLTGLLATATLDVWAQFLKWIAGVSPTNWAMVGRWFAHVLRGQFRQKAITQVPAVPNELLIGWLLHYIVGMSYGLIYFFVSDVLSLPITLLSALTFGLITVLAPWLILQPGLGMGCFAANTPNPGKTRILNVISHTVFGLGLFFAWRFVE